MAEIPFLHRKTLERGAGMVIVVLIALAGVSCYGRRTMYGTVETVAIESELLQKTMRVSVHLPERFDPNQRYAVLYFIPHGGGGAGIVTYTTSRDRACRKVFKATSSERVIIVGVPHDGSFLLDTEPPHRDLVATSGLQLRQGYYESFFLRELIPYIEETYPIYGDRGRRYIGGYSMGGYAALRIGLTHPGLFSKVGAHSPTLFLQSLPDATVTGFMYPNEDARARRDPLLLVTDAIIPDDTEFYLDTGPIDVNREACDLMYELLIERNANAEYHNHTGTHGIGYMNQYLPEYLRFYLEIGRSSRS